MVCLVNKGFLALIQRNSEIIVYHIVKLGMAENGTENTEILVDHTVRQ